MISILILVGASGCGKTYMEKMLTDYSSKEDSKYCFIKLKQVTTRERREDESIDAYEWVTKEEYDLLQYNNLLVACTCITRDCKKDYYGTLCSISRDIKKSEFPFLSSNIEKIKDNGTIYTVVANKLGIENLSNWINFINNHSSKIICKYVLMIDSPNPVERLNRSKKYVENERRELLPFIDHILINKDKSETNARFLTENDILELLERDGFISSDYHG